ncbi:glycine cleavage system aminomethyltransferase GcvT [Cucumibacter marinus]|uniref:glycine cleavage system aminomethyltransferase GcvT n=1 Tax=Cucumibacter marinus TaxID=1121252 RepID=UPI0004082831|nr:glycine cleavage system aminomethyltransferase GcvT [Cucumibacter marinus]
MTDTDLKKTPLYAAHAAAGAKFVGFAGYDMPIQYPLGVLKEHLHCRAEAGLFDVSHMGQAELHGPDDETTSAFLESLVPADIVNLGAGKQRYTQLLTEDGGIIDDLMVSKLPEGEGKPGQVNIVVNASRKDIDYARIEANLPDSITLTKREDLALIALQGPAAEAVLAELAPEVADMAFMQVAVVTIDGTPMTVSRSGYTGEDGYEISVPADKAEALWNRFAASDRVEPVGLGARDSLRLEAGLCLYGNDITTTTTPIEAGLIWSIQKRRREEGGFPGAGIIQREIATGALKKRVGLVPEGKAPIRAGVVLFDSEEATKAVGHVTSGSPGPNYGAPVAMGYVITPLAAKATVLYAEVRGRRVPVTVTPMPFVPANFKR